MLSYKTFLSPQKLQEKGYAMNFRVNAYFWDSLDILFFVLAKIIFRLTMMKFLCPKEFIISSEKKNEPYFMLWLLKWNYFFLYKQIEWMTHWLLNSLLFINFMEIDKQWFPYLTILVLLSINLYQVVYDPTTSLPLSSHQASFPSHYLWLHLI